MKITLINGSPKKKYSGSQELLEALNMLLKNSPQPPVTSVLALNGEEALTGEALEEIRRADVLVLAFPLYVDGIPSQLLHCLCTLEKELGYGSHGGGKRVYGIVNNGFKEGLQNSIALQQLFHWTKHIGAVWGQGIGFGGGGALAALRSVSFGKGPKSSIGKALGAMAANILAGASGENLFISLDMPRFAYKVTAEQGWRQAVRKRGLKASDLSRRL